MNKAVKNKFVVVLLAIAVFIPTVVAIVSYNREKDGPVDVKSVVSMTISDLDGKEYALDKNNAEDEKIIQLFVDINESSTEVGVLPEALRTESFYLVVMSNGATNATYQYYFNESGTSTYYMDGEGKAYMVDDAKVAEFLKTSYSASVYDSAKLPSLVIADQGEVKPAAASWFYKDHSGEFLPRDCSGSLISESVVYPASGTIPLDFDVDPDYFFLTVKNASDGEVLFDDSYENIGKLTFDGAAQVIVDVSAKWYEEDDRDFYGEISYSFGAEIAAPAEFYLGVNEIKTGEFVSVTAKNIKDPAQITFASAPDIGYTPTFYADGDVYRALIPVSIEKGAGSFKFTFGYGGTSQEVNLTVKEKTYRANDYVVDAAKGSLFADDKKEAAREALGAVFEAGSETRYFAGDFAKVFEDNQINRYFGRLYTVSTSKTVFREAGVEYKAAAGTDVKVCQKGEVVYVGSTDISGNIVIVEHGYGLKTVYAHLASTSVEVGAVIEKGTVVGKCGNTGFTNTNGVYFGMYIGDVQVCPYPTWHDGDWKEVPFYKG